MSDRDHSQRGEHVCVVVPVMNEAPVLAELRQRLEATLEPLDPDFAVILVDDGSDDGTGPEIDRIHAEDSRFKCIHLSRNFGHQAAVTAGLAHANGDVIGVMDGDLQDPPEVLAALVAEWRKGSDVVYAIRTRRKEARLKVAAYDLFYRVLSRLSAVPLPLDAGDFCVVDARVLREMNRLPERERFVRGLRAWVGFRQTGITYERDARAGGDSKYTLLGLARLGINGIVSLSVAPLIAVMLFGLLVSAAAFLYGAYLVALTLFFGGIITGYASLMAGLLFLSGIQLVGLGVVGIYLAKVYQEVKARPTYIARSLRGLESPGGPDAP